MDKLKNFPSVYSPTVIGREDRANYMLAQAEKYNLNLHLLPVKDYHTNRDSFRVSGPMIQPDNFGYCTFISYLQCMKKWYEETKEDNLIMVVLYNNMMDELKKITKEQIMNSNWKIKYFFEKALTD